MAGQLAVVEESPAYWRVVFDNPPINLIDDANILEFLDLLDKIKNDEDLKVVVFESANPDYFIAHFGPAKGVKNLTTPHQESGALPWPHFAASLQDLPVVTISKVRGRARGVGSEFTLATDMRFASLEKAIFSQIEFGSGTIPGGGAIEHLTELAGRARALEIFFSSADCDAKLAERYNWINRALPDAELDGFVDSLARRIASFDKQPIAEIKAIQKERGNIATLEALDDTQKRFFSSLSWPGAAARFPVLAKHGSGDATDFELNFAERLLDPAVTSDIEKAVQDQK